MGAESVSRGGKQSEQSGVFEIKQRVQVHGKCKFKGHARFKSVLAEKKLMLGPQYRCPAGALNLLANGAGFPEWASSRDAPERSGQERFYYYYYFF